MKSPAARPAAWIALTLVVAASFGPRVVPALDASLAGVAQLCAPAPAHIAAAKPSDATHPDRTPLRVPRCGVA